MTLLRLAKTQRLEHGFNHTDNIPGLFTEVVDEHHVAPETPLPTAMEGIKQFYIALEKEDWKLDTLCDLYETLTITQAIVYTNTSRKVEWLTGSMIERDFPVSLLHGDMEQEERDGIMREFRTGSSRVLITTDLVAPGVDVQQVSLVINYDLPTNGENYSHRIGHGGCFGRKGVGTYSRTRRHIHALLTRHLYSKRQIRARVFSIDIFFVSNIGPLPLLFFLCCILCRFELPLST
jgi:hypothetical protein